MMYIERENTLSSAIGLAFERSLKNRFPFIEKNEKGSNLPDFISKGFYLEAKGHYYEYGGRIKWEQVEKFHSLTSPVFYMYGSHSVRGLSKLPKSIAFNVVSKLKFDNLYLIDNALIEPFFVMEQRFSKKQRENGDNHYCVFKPRHARDIISNNIIKRGNEKILSNEFYGINSEEWNFSKINDIQLLVLKKNVKIISPLLS